MLRLLRPDPGSTCERVGFVGEALKLRVESLLAILTIVDDNLQPNVIEIGYHALKALLLGFEFHPLSTQLGKTLKLLGTLILGRLGRTRLRWGRSLDCSLG